MAAEKLLFKKLIISCSKKLDIKLVTCHWHLTIDKKKTTRQ